LAAGNLDGLDDRIQHYELNIFVNPVASGRDMRIFKDRTALRLTGSTAYSSGVVVNTYQPVR
jgi:hypothetical protein